MRGGGGLVVTSRISCSSAVPALLLLLQLSSMWEPAAGQLIDRNCFGSENATLSGEEQGTFQFMGLKGLSNEN